MGYKIEKTELYQEWFDGQPPKFQAQIEKRLSNIQHEGHFGHAKQLAKNLAEIKFNNGSTSLSKKITEKSLSYF